jgi:hypothetical protein
MNANRNCLLVFLILIATDITANTISIESRFSAGVRAERRACYALAPEHEQRLVRSLQRITGCAGLEFAPDGSLCVNAATEASCGSGEARRLLTRVLSSGKNFVIEDHSGSPSVVFGEAEREQIYDIQTRKRTELWRLRLDFNDFFEIEAPADVHASFDEGFTVLHELLHGLGYGDASRKDELGACEELLNIVRRELGLPLRDQYFGEASRITTNLLSVRLRFNELRRNGSRTQSKSRYLFFLLPQLFDSSVNLRAVTRVERKSFR